MIDDCIDSSNCKFDASDCILNDEAIREALSRDKAGSGLDYESGQKVFKMGKKVVGFYVVCQGIIKEFTYQNGENITLSVFKHGDLLTGGAFFRETEWHQTTAESITQSRVIFLSRELLPRLMKVAGDTIGGKLAQNIKGLRRRLGLVSCSVLENTAFWLVRLLPDSANSFTMSNKELASIVGCSPVTMSRKLSKLAGENLIEKNGQEIRIPEKDELRNVAPGVELT